jgi:L-lysine 2,3-aminomutase
VQVKVIAICKLNEMLLDQRVHPVFVFQNDLSDDAFFALDRNAGALLGDLGEGQNGHRSGSERE